MDLVSYPARAEGLVNMDKTYFQSSLSEYGKVCKPKKG